MFGSSAYVTVNPESSVTGDSPISTFYGSIPHDANGFHRYIRNRQNYQYEGEFKDGRIHGRGVSIKTHKGDQTMTVKRGVFKDGFFYEGEVVTQDQILVGKFIGNSTLHDPNGYIHYLKEGVTYRGNVNNGEPDLTGSWVYTPIPDNSPILTNQRTDYQVEEVVRIRATNPERKFKDGVYYGEWRYHQPNGVGLYDTPDTTYMGLFRNGQIIKGMKVVRAEFKYYRGMFENWQLNDPKGVIEVVLDNQVYIGDVISDIPQGGFNKDPWADKEKVANFNPISDEVLNIDTQTHGIPTIKAVMDHRELVIPKDTFGRYQVSDPYGRIYYIGDLYYGQFHGIGYKKSKKGYRVGLFIKGLLINGEYKRGNLVFKGKFSTVTTHNKDYSREELNDPKGTIRNLNQGITYRGPTKLGRPDTKHADWATATVTITDGPMQFTGSSTTTRPLSFKINGGEWPVATNLPAHYYCYDKDIAMVGPIEVSVDSPTIDTVSVLVNVTTEIGLDKPSTKLTPFCISKIKFVDGCTFVGRIDLEQYCIQVVHGGFSFPHGEVRDKISRWDQLETAIYLLARFSHFPYMFKLAVAKHWLLGRDLISIVDQANDANISYGNNQSTSWFPWWSKPATSNQMFTDMGIHGAVHQTQFKNCLNPI